MATEGQNTLIALGAMSLATILGMSSALLYSKRSVEAAEDKYKQQMRKERRRNRELYR